MKKSLLSLLIAGLVLSGVPPANGQAPSAPPDRTFQYLFRPGNPWRAKTVPPVRFQNSGRIEALMRGGQLYLSLSDAIALALENNLDLELQRYGPGIAESDVVRAAGGGATRGVGLSVTEAPNGIGGPAAPLLNAAAGAFSVTTTVPGNVSDLAATTQSQTNLSITAALLSPGPPIPSFDPFILGNWSATHQTTPQTSSLITGTPLLINRIAVQSTGYQQGFSTGTQVALNYNANSQETNSIRSLVNPFSTASLGLTVTQPLFRGLGMGVNKRYIRIARNDQRISDLVFTQQAISTVSGVTRLYYDLISLNEDVNVKQQTLALARKLYENNQAQFRAGTLAEIEVVRAQAQMAAAREDLANSQAFAREQELILKNVLTRRGTADPAIRDTHIVTTDVTPTPGPQPIEPIQDLIATAFKNRPDLLAANLQITNSEISLEGSRSQVRPEIDLVATAQNNGLAGQINPLAPIGGVFGGGAPPAFIGGFGLALEQIARRNYPVYGIGLQVSLPLRNRVAQADYVRDQLQFRQFQIRRQQLENQVRLEVEDSVIALNRTRAAYEAAVQTRVLQEQSLASEEKRYAVGLSTTFLVIQYQSFLAQARSTEVAVRGTYAKALVQLQRSLGLTLPENNITIDEAYSGTVKRPPSPLPPPR